ncbi:MAG: hypothetical protein K2G28_07835, partial [Acetatifactor sp.]|nr:hypothetical protein [Acetatifactor sp.]
MSEAYVECLVKAKPSILGKFFKYLLIMLTVALALLMFLTMNVILMILAVVTGVGAYFVNLFT